MTDCKRCNELALECNRCYAARKLAESYDKLKAEGKIGGKPNESKPTR